MTPEIAIDYSGIPQIPAPIPGDQWSSGITNYSVPERIFCLEGCVAARKSHTWSTSYVLTIDKAGQHYPASTERTD